MPDDTAPTWRNRRLIRRRWRNPEQARKAPRADKLISVRVTEAELAELDVQIAVLGIKRNRALRIAARRIGGFLEIDAALVAELRALNRQIAGIATNVNQIAHAANRTHDPDYRAFLEERAELGRVLLEVRGLLQRMLDLGARREDGLARLRAAAAIDTAGGEPK
ncbi:DNA mobilization endonuclease VirD1/MobC family subunit [Amaricoccus sp. W119]|uniref:DNA mobilization endonuclease VirD1/MobC family subunit n=1 Tax=Amaricoccus sp. W119 TaxID=3391833 RepID=UPI0039A54EA9